LHLSRLLLGKGCLPDPLRAELEGEGVQQLEEGLFGTITLRGYKAPHERSSVSKQAFVGAIAVTRKRLVVWSGSRLARPWYGTQVNVGFDDQRYGNLEIAAESNDRLLIATRLEEFHPDRSGRFEIRLRTPKALELAEFALAAR
jgi:hypothetical protein